MGGYKSNMPNNLLSSLRPSEVVRAGVNQLGEWAKDSPAVDEANAHHAYNKVVEASKAASEGLSKAEREQVTNFLF